MAGLEEVDKLVAEIDELVASCSNWGRWGANDGRGTLNLITSERRLRAVGLVREGNTVPLGRHIVTRSSPANRTPMLHHMTEVPADAGDEPRGTSGDFVGFVLHGFDVTHVDALCHQAWRGRLYNGQPADLISARSGAAAGSIEFMCEGIAGRGVLLDLPAHRGVEWLDPGEEIAAEELEDCASAFGVDVGAGDLLVVRTGRDRREEDLGQHDPLQDGNPGLALPCARWLQSRDVAALLTDVQADVIRPGEIGLPMPLHVTCLVAMGMPLVDNAALEELAAACTSRGTWEFLLVVAPLWLQRSTGSPVNPVAMF